MGFKLKLRFKIEIWNVKSGIILNFCPFDGLKLGDTTPQIQILNSPLGQCSSFFYFIESIIDHLCRIIDHSKLVCGLYGHMRRVVN